MLKLSKRIEYGLIAMLYIAHKSPTSLTTARELAEKFRLPAEMLGKVLQALARGGFITSVQGVKGGYKLAKPLEEIKLTAIVTALEGQMFLVNCLKNETKACKCERGSLCNIRIGMRTIQTKLNSFLNTISLKDLQDEYVRYFANSAESTNPAVITAVKE